MISVRVFSKYKTSDPILFIRDFLPNCFVSFYAPIRVIDPFICLSNFWEFSICLKKGLLVPLEVDLVPVVSLRNGCYWN